MSKTAAHNAIDPRLRFWRPVCLSKMVTSQLMHITICDVPIVIYRLDGEVHALYDRCSHRRMPLSKGRLRGDRLVCPYHGCEFLADGKGYCPTTKKWNQRVKSFLVREYNNVVWITYDDSKDIQDTSFDEVLHEFPSDDISFSGVVHKRIKAPMQVVVDNMTELEHTGEVHKSLAFPISGYGNVSTSCELNGSQVDIFYRGPQRRVPLYLQAVSGMRDGDDYVQTATFKMMPPHGSYHIWWEKSSVIKSFSMRFIIYYTEVSAHETHLFSFVYWQHKSKILSWIMTLFAPFFMKIVSAELERDKIVMEKLAEDDVSIERFNLHKFDQPLVYTRQLANDYYDPKTIKGGTNV